MTASPLGLRRSAGTGERPFRLAVDARVVQDSYHGIGRQTFELLRALEVHDEVSLELIHSSEGGGRLSLNDISAKPNRLYRLDAPVASLSQQLQWPRVLRRLEADLLLVPYHLAVPWHAPMPVTCFVHDCIFEADRAYAPNSRVRHLYRVATRVALARSASVLTVSEATRADLSRHYGIVLPETHVIRNGVDSSFQRPIGRTELERARAELALPERYVLHVGVARPHKNQAVVVRALAHLLDLDPRVHLVLVGSRDPRFRDDAEAAVNELGLGERVRRIENVPEALMPSLYQAASCFAFPSKVEGFGLPLLEAMASRVPVVASNVPALSEIAGDAAILVDPADVRGWADALRRALTEPRLASTLVERGDAVAKRCTWSRAAEQLLAVLKEERS
jgi:glycosyltransferase involved in cell wall biosynthesis